MNRDPKKSNSTGTLQKMPTYANNARNKETKEQNYQTHLSILKQESHICPQFRSIQGLFMSVSMFCFACCCPRGLH